MRPLPPGSSSTGSCSSALAFSARSSLRIEFTRISQMVFFWAGFLPTSWSHTPGCAARLRPGDERPSSACRRTLESLPKTTQRCHSVCEMYLPSFL